jgi:hypothetical protein
LAHRGNRSPYDWKKVGVDTVDNWTREILHAVEENYHVIICTARDGCCIEETKDWLYDNGISYSEIHIRPEGNTENDYMIKDRMWRDIATRYCICGIFDDRQRVIFHARHNCGLKVFEVNYGNF